MKITNPGIWIIILLVFVAGMLLWRGYMPPRDEAEHGNDKLKESLEPSEAFTTVRIGVISSTDQIHQYYEFLGELALQEVNRFCEEEGSRFRFDLVYNCSKGHAGNAREITEWFEGHNITLVVGYDWGSIMHASMKRILETDMAAISIGADWFGWAGIWPNVLRLRPHQFRQIKPLAQTMMDLNKTDVIIIHGSSPHDISYVKGHVWGNLTDFIEEYEGLGGRVVEVIQMPSVLQHIDFYKYLEKAESALNNLTVKQGSGGTALLFVNENWDYKRQLQKVGAFPGLMNVTWFSVDRQQPYSSLMMKKEVSNVRIYHTVRFYHLQHTFTENSIYERVNEPFQERFNFTLGFQSASFYDACWIMALSVIEADTSNSTAIIETMYEVASTYEGASGPCAVDWTYYRVAVDYEIYGFFEVDDETKRLKCGVYNGTTNMISWDENMINLLGVETK